MNIVTEHLIELNEKGIFIIPVGVMFDTSDGWVSTTIKVPTVRIDTKDRFNLSSIAETKISIGKQSFIFQVLGFGIEIYVWKNIK